MVTETSVGHMITDARVLRGEFVPRDVEHRDGEVAALSTSLEPLLDGEPAEPSILFGPSGAGKTCIARYTLDSLKQTALDIDALYVNCWQTHTGYRVLYRILEGLGLAVDVHRGSTPRDELVRRLRDYDGPPCVLLFDEADQLAEKELFYIIHDLPQFASVLITNDEHELFADADGRITSRFAGAQRIPFDRYSEEALVAILDARVQWGLAEDAVEPDVTRRIADVAAGDARAGLSILRNAARKADREGKPAIDVPLVDTVVPASKAEVRQKNVEVLNSHQRVLYDLVDEAGDLGAPEIYERYRAAVDDPRAERTLRSYLKKLEQYNLIAFEGTSRDRRYLRVDY